MVQTVHTIPYKILFQNKEIFLRVDFRISYSLQSPTAARQN